MRVVFLSCQPPHHMAPPSLSDEQINCGPWFLHQQIGERWLSHPTPYGEFDVRQLMAELPTEQYPDVVVCHVDCGFGVKPRHLGSLRCPAVLLAADSHWGDRALSSMIAYATSEPFSQVIVLYDRHHLEFFRAAGIKNIHWFPALTFPHPDARVEAALRGVREHRLALVGMVGYHLRRQRLFAALIAANLPLAWRQVRQADAIAHYGSSLIGINVVMNGDVNLRVFEVIAGGAMLLTDRLSADAGLDHLLVEGREKVSYANEREFVDHARYFLSHPEEARAIGGAGQRWFQEHFNEQRRRWAFGDLVLNGRDLPEFAIPPAGKVWVDFGAGHLPLEGTLACYDVLNELHREQEQVTVQVDRTVPEAFASVVATLPRTRLVRGAAAPGQPRPDLLVCGREDVPKPQAMGASRVWCWDWPREMVPALQARLVPAGWTPVRPQVALFQARQAPVPVHQQKAAEARRYLDAGDQNGALKFAREALASNPNSIEACLVMAELAFEVKNTSLCDKMLLMAKRAEPGNPRIPLLKWGLLHQPAPWQPGRLLGMAWKAVESLNFTAADEYAKRALQADSSLADAYYVAGLAQAWLRQWQTGPPDAEERLRAEIEALEKAAKLDASRAEIQFALALAYRGANRLAEAARAFEAYVSLESNGATGWFGLGESQLRLGQLQPAAAAFAAGLARAPNDRWLKQYHALANEPSRSNGASFVARVFAVHGQRVDGPPLAANIRWMQLVAQRPNLACVRPLAAESAITDHEALRLIMLCFRAAVAASRSVREHEVPGRAVLFGHQAWFGFDMRRLVSRSFDDGVLLVLMDGEPAAGADRLTEVNNENLRSLTHRGISLWSVCVYRLMVQLRSLPSDFDLDVPGHLDAVQALYGAAMAAIDEANAFCDFYHPDSIVIAQGYDIVAAALRNVGLQRGVRVVAIENTFHRERLLWEDISGIAVNINQAKNYFWRYRDSIPDELAAGSVDAYLRSMGTLKSVEHTSPAGAMLAPSPGQACTITYIGQVGVDSSVLFGLRGFKSQVEVIAALAAYAAENSCRLLIKLHPKESPRYPDPVPYYRRLTAGWLEQHAGFQESRRQLGPSLVLDDENQFNTYDLIRQADVCVTITSQAGLEALLLGKEVVLCGDAFYGSLGFTHEATDECSLRYQLGRVLHNDHRVNDPIQCAKFFHSFTELYCLHKSENALLELLSGRPPLPPLTSVRHHSGSPSELADRKEPLEAERCALRDEANSPKLVSADRKGRVRGGESLRPQGIGADESARRGPPVLAGVDGWGGQ